MCGCTRSVKSWSVEHTYVHDNFTQACPWDKSNPSHSSLQISDLSFNLTEQPGVLHGHWPLT